jgi:hypothetical protein
MFQAVRLSYPKFRGNHAVTGTAPVQMMKKKLTVLPRHTNSKRAAD